MSTPVSLPPATDHAARPHGKRWIKAALLKFTRVFHIYFMMLGLALMTFFAVTGFMLNHDEWFEGGRPVTRTATGQFPRALLHPPLDKLAIAEKLRADFHITGMVVEFTAEPDEVHVTYKGPGRRTDAALNPGSGAVELTFESRGIIGRLTDLHKGADSGTAWKRVIDAVAIFVALGVLTGLILWWRLPKRRHWGVIAVLLGAGASLALYLLLVP